MNHAKKMILVPSETLQKLHQPSVSTDPLIELNKELSRILASNNVNDSEKWASYQKVLERSLRHIEKRRKPLAFSIAEGEVEAEQERQPGPPPPMVVRGLHQVQQVLQPPAAHPVEQLQQQPHSSRSTRHSYEDILATIPKTYQTKGSVLLEKLSNSDLIKWDETGSVQIENKTIHGANMADLINDALRNRKSVSAPDGYREFYRILSKLNTPRELVGNDARWSLIRNFAAGTKGPKSPYFDTLYPETPVKPKKRAKSSENSNLGPARRKLSWESFNF